MALLQDMFSLYTDNTTGALIGVLVATVAVYFIFFGKFVLFDVSFSESEYSVSNLLYR
jgi:hypothetical protein